MQYADRLTCTLPETTNDQLVCDIQSSFDWIALGSMVGTILAACVAAFFGIHAIFQAQDSRREEEKAKRLLIMENTGRRLIEILDEIHAEAPEIDLEKFMELSAVAVKYSLSARSPGELAFVSTMNDSFGNLRETGKLISKFYSADAEQKRPANETTYQLEYLHSTYKGMVKSIRDDTKLLLDSLDAFRSVEVFNQGVFDAMAAKRHGHSDYKDYVEQTLNVMYREGSGSPN